MGWLFAVQVAYGGPSLLLLIFFFVLLAVDGKFKHSFYRVVQFDIFVNICCYVNSWVAIRLEAFGVGGELLVLLERLLPGTLTLSKFMAAWFFHMQCVSSLLLCFHRLTSLFKKSDEVWAKLYMLAVVGGILYSTAAMTPFIFGGFTARISLVNGVLNKTVDEVQLNLLYSMNPIFGLIYFLLITCSGVATILVVKSIYEGMNMISVDTSLLLKKLTKVAVVNSAVMSGNLLYTIVFGMMVAAKISLAGNMILLTNSILPFSSDMMTLAMPYILLVLDNNVHQSIGITKRSSVVVNLSTTV